MKEWIVEFFAPLKVWLVDILMPLSDWFFMLVLAVPLGFVRLIFLGILALLAVWVLKLPPQRREGKDGQEGAILSDLRLYAIGLLMLQSIFYLIF